MLAGRKLLLADDSVTIQKVVGLTFADEGVTVVSVGNGEEAIGRLEEVAPDIVLADVFMPQGNGYELCEYIKTDDKLKHIPVMLLVGSFEPFDEAEARRVGADDVLTKPFQSIRRLIEKVGELISGKPPEEELPTVEFPKVEKPAPEPERLSASELEITTADTLPLPVAAQAANKQDFAVETNVEEQSAVSAGDKSQNETAAEPADVFLDLGDFESAPAISEDELILDLDLDDEDLKPSRVEPAYSSPIPAFAEAEVSGGRNRGAEVLAPEQSNNDFAPPVVQEYPVAITNQREATQDRERVEDLPEKGGASEESQAQAALAEPGIVREKSEVVNASPGQINLQQLSSETIDAIARRAVEQLSQKVVEEIAWEVIPQLAELLIKRQLEERESQTK